MGRYRLAAIYFLAILFALSLTQIFIDSQTGTSTHASTQAVKRTYTIFVEIEDKTLYLLENGKCIKEYRIASGMSGLPSPLGCWKIVEKGDWGEGFGGRWMGLDVPWGTFGFGTLFRIQAL